MLPTACLNFTTCVRVFVYLRLFVRLRVRACVCVSVYDLRLRTFFPRPDDARGSF